jgi:hypothetical protein
MIILLSLTCAAQNDKPIRAPFELKLAVDEKEFYGMDVQESPYFVKDKTLQIFSSEKINVEIEIKNDTIFSMKVVDKNINPDKTITITFEQITEGRKPVRTQLTVSNPVNKVLNYDALMYTVDSKRWLKTSIMAIYPNLQGIELWNDKIITLVLYNWRLEN